MDPSSADIVILTNNFIGACSQSENCAVVLREQHSTRVSDANTDPEKRLLYSFTCGISLGNS
jgi:hypothetical protein